MMDGKVSNFQQIASVRRYTLTGGIEDGLKVLDCDNGNIRFLLNESKACDIMQIYHQGTNISFISKNDFTKRETDFLNRFEGGMLYTCGLDNLGRREGYQMHGTFHNIPAQIVCARCDEQGIEVQAIIRNTALFGKNLVMKRKIFSEIGSDCVIIEDWLVNEGYKDEEYCLLYHINLGYPMLDVGAKIVAEVKERKTTSEWAKQNEGTAFVIEEAVPNAEETCYYLTLNNAEISLINEKLGKNFSLAYSGDTLPYFLEWKSRASGDYALGLEPCTTELDDGFSYKIIKPKESVCFQLKLMVSNLL